MPWKPRRLASLAVLVSTGAGLRLFVACGGSPAAPVPRDLGVEDAIRISCDVAAPTACPVPSPHYSDVAPILQKSCVPCHPGPAADPQWPLTEYEDVAPWAD